LIERPNVEGSDGRSHANRADIQDTENPRRGGADDSTGLG
jgi:hypothetical protein